MMIKNKHIILMFGGSILLLIASALVGLVGLPQEPGGSLIIRFDVASNEAGLLGGSGTFFACLEQWFSWSFLTSFLRWRYIIERNFYHTR